MAAFVVLSFDLVTNDTAKFIDCFDDVLVSGGLYSLWSELSETSFVFFTLNFSLHFKIEW